MTWSVFRAVGGVPEASTRTILALMLGGAVIGGGTFVRSTSPPWAVAMPMVPIAALATAGLLVGPALTGNGAGALLSMVVLAALAGSGPGRGQPEFMFAAVIAAWLVVADLGDVDPLPGIERFGPVVEEPEGLLAMAFVIGLVLAVRHVHRRGLDALADTGSAAIAALLVLAAIPPNVIVVAILVVATSVGVQVVAVGMRSTTLRVGSLVSLLLSGVSIAGSGHDVAGAAVGVMVGAACLGAAVVVGDAALRHRLAIGLGLGTVGEDAPLDPFGPGAGWFADPTGQHDLRFHDGRQWTTRVLDDERGLEDVVDPPDRIPSARDAVASPPPWSPQVAPPPPPGHRPFAPPPPTPTWSPGRPAHQALPAAGPSSLWGRVFCMGAGVLLCTAALSEWDDEAFRGFVNATGTAFDFWALSVGPGVLLILAALMTDVRMAAPIVSGFGLAYWPAWNATSPIHRTFDFEFFPAESWLRLAAIGCAIVALASGFTQCQGEVRRSGATLAIALGGLVFCLGVAVPPVAGPDFLLHLWDGRLAFDTLQRVAPLLIVGVLAIAVAVTRQRRLVGALLGVCVFYVCSWVVSVRTYYRFDVGQENSQATMVVLLQSAVAVLIIATLVALRSSGARSPGYGAPSARGTWSPPPPHGRI